MTGLTRLKQWFQCPVYLFSDDTSRSRAAVVFNLQLSLHSRLTSCGFPIKFEPNSWLETKNKAEVELQTLGHFSTSCLCQVRLVCS